MTFRDKTDYFIEDMKRRKIDPYTAAPPIFRFLWRKGLRLPPPFFLSFSTLTLFTGGVFGSIWGISMCIIMGLVSGFTVSTITTWLLGGVVAGMLFGVSMATYFRFMARKLKLPSWADYTPEQNLF